MASPLKICVNLSPALRLALGALASEQGVSRSYLLREALLREMAVAGITLPARDGIKPQVAPQVMRPVGTLTRMVISVTPAFRTALHQLAELRGKTMTELVVDAAVQLVATPVSSDRKARDPAECLLVCHVSRALRHQVETEAKARGVSMSVVLRDVAASALTGTTPIVSNARQGVARLDFKLSRAERAAVAAAAATLKVTSTNYLRAAALGYYAGQQAAPTYTIAQAATAFGVREGTLRAWIVRGNVPAPTWPERGNGYYTQAELEAVRAAVERRVA